MKSVALIVTALMVVAAMDSPVPVPEAAAAVTAEEPKVEMVFAELESEVEADEAEVDAESEPIHEHFRQFTHPMELLPNDHTTLVEVAAESEAEAEADAEGDDDAAGGDAAGGSNPTYILPVDPFNYFPFFNGFSNVNPFSQFYPPPPYLYPQYTNYMHQYATHGAGHPPGYPYPGHYGGVAGGMPMRGGAGFPYNYPAPHPHMHYPFGAYKMDVSGPDVRTGTNNPPPFPQFSELSSETKLIHPEIIPKSEEEVAEAEESGEEEGDTVIASFIQTGEQETDADAEGDEFNAEDVEYEAEGAESAGEAEDVEYMADEDEAESAEASDVEIVDEEAENDMTDEIEYQNDAEEDTQAEDVEYTQ